MMVSSPVAVQEVEHCRIFSTEYRAMIFLAVLFAMVHKPKFLTIHESGYRSLLLKALAELQDREQCKNRRAQMLFGGLHFDTRLFPQIQTR